MRTARAGHIEDCPAMPGPRDKRHRTRRSALLKRATGIPIRHRGGRTPGDARLNCGPSSRIARPLHHHGRCRTNLKRRRAHNAGDQRLAALGDPHRPILSRGRCIAWFASNDCRHRSYELQRLEPVAILGGRHCRYRGSRLLSSTHQLNKSIRNCITAANSMTPTPMRIASDRKFVEGNTARVSGPSQ